MKITLNVKKVYAMVVKSKNKQASTPAQPEDEGRLLSSQQMSSDQETGIITHGSLDVKTEASQLPPPHQVDETQPTMTMSSNEPARSNVDESPSPLTTSDDPPTNTSHTTQAPPTEASGARMILFAIGFLACIYALHEVTPSPRSYQNRDYYASVLLTGVNRSNYDFIGSSL